MKDIFISYSRKDTADAEKFRDLLEEEGWSVFWDVEILPGDAWSDQLEKKLNGCKCIVVLWSKNSTASDYVKEEAAIGKNAKKLVPIMIGFDTPPPFGFGMIEAAMLNNWNGDKENREYKNLIKAITALVPPRKSVLESPSASHERTGKSELELESKLESKSKKAPSTGSSATATNTTPPQKSKMPMLIGLALLAVMIAGFFYLKSSFDKHDNHNKPDKISNEGTNETDTNTGAIIDTDTKTDEKTGDENKVEIERLKKSISDIKMRTKSTLDRELQLVGADKKEIVDAKKLTQLKRISAILNDRMQKWVATGANNLDQLKAIEADSKKYANELNGGLAGIFKVVTGPDQKALDMIAKLFGSNERIREGARNDLMKTYGKDPKAMGALIKQCNLEFDKDFNNGGLFQAIYALDKISEKSPESLIANKDVLVTFLTKARKKYGAGTKGKIDQIVRRL